MVAKCVIIAISWIMRGGRGKIFGGGLEGDLTKMKWEQVLRG